MGTAGCPEQSTSNADGVTYSYHELNRDIHDDCDDFGDNAMGLMRRHRSKLGCDAHRWDLVFDTTLHEQAGESLLAKRDCRRAGI